MSNIEIKRMWCNAGKHDKVYGAYYNTDERIMLTIYGRRGKSLKAEPHPNTSYSEFIDKYESKLNPGGSKEPYFEIDDADREEVEVRLALDEIANKFEGFTGILKSSVEEVEEAGFTFSGLKEDEIVTCVNDSGLENFEEGVTYLFKRNLENGIIVVENMEGEEEEVLADRFEIGEVEYA
jgi:hypothetical protein